MSKDNTNGVVGNIATRDTIAGEQLLCEFDGIGMWVMPSLPKGTMNRGGRGRKPRVQCLKRQAAEGLERHHEYTCWSGSQGLADGLRVGEHEWAMQVTWWGGAGG